jgi:hypothetical protein
MDVVASGFAKDRPLVLNPPPLDTTMSGSISSAGPRCAAGPKCPAISVIAKVSDWRLVPGLVEEHSAILVFDPNAPATPLNRAAAELAIGNPRDT